jgi:hypothetical protein
MIVMFDICKIYPLWLPPCTEIPTIIEETPLERTSRLLAEMAEKITASFNQMTNNFVEAFETLLERTEL